MNLPRVHPRVAVTQQTSVDGWSTGLAVILAASAYVTVEPAPFDALMIGFSVLFLVVVGFRVPQVLFPVTLTLSLFFLFHLPGLLLVTDWERALLYGLITVYLAVAAYVVALVVTMQGPAAVLAGGVGYSGAILLTFLAVLLDASGVLPLRDEIYFGGTRLKGFFKDPNVLGPAAIPALMLAFPMAAHLVERGTSRLVAYSGASFVATVSAWIVYSSYSRGAWAACLAAILAASALGTYFRPTAIRLAALGFAGLFAVVSLTSPGSLISALEWVGNKDSMLLERLAGGQLQRYDEDRFAIHELLLDKIGDNPLGFGPGQTETYVGANYSTVSGSGASHNSYVRVAFEYGIAGLLTYIALVAITLWFAFVVSSRAGSVGAYGRALFAVNCAVLVSAVAIDTIHWRHYWVVMGLTWGLFAWVRAHERSDALSQR